MPTYKIVRFFKDENKKSEVIETGLSLDEVKKHCSSPDSKGEDWFDGWTEE